MEMIDFDIFYSAHPISCDGKQYTEVNKSVTSNRGRIVTTLTFVKFVSVNNCIHHIRRQQVLFALSNDNKLLCWLTM